MFYLNFHKFHRFFLKNFNCAPKFNKKQFMCSCVFLANISVAFFCNWGKICFCRPPEPAPVIPQILQQRATGPFRLDPDTINDIERDWVKSDKIKEKPSSVIDMNFLNESIKIACTNGTEYPADKLNQLLSNSPSRPQSANATLYNTYHQSPSHNYSSTNSSRLSNNNNDTQWVFFRRTNETSSSESEG